MDNEGMMLFTQRVFTDNLFFFNLFQYLILLLFWIKSPPVLLIKKHAILFCSLLKMKIWYKRGRADHKGSWGCSQNLFYRTFSMDNSTSFMVSSFPLISYFFMFKSFAHYGYTVLRILKDANNHEPKLYRKWFWFSISPKNYTTTLILPPTYLKLMAKSFFSFIYSLAKEFMEVLTIAIKSL